MTREEVQKLRNGVYRIFWKDRRDGDYGVASVGRNRDGDVWILPSNWSDFAGATDWQSVWREVDSVRLIDTGRYTSAYGATACEDHLPSEPKPQEPRSVKQEATTLTITLPRPQVKRVVLEF